MARRYRVLLEARHELASAAAYHEEQREGLGLQLLDAYDAVIERALKFPNSGTRVDLKSGFEVRRFQLRRFRYAVFAALVDDELVVFCVSNHKRKPSYWTERLKKVDR